MKQNRLLLLLMACTYAAWAYAGDPKVVSVTEYGAAPGSGNNTVHAIRTALYLNKKEESLVLRFPQGRYDFWPDSANNNTRGFSLFKRKNIVIEGNHSQFVFHGRMAPLFLDSCENIRLQDFSIDWERPYFSQAVIQETTADYVTIAIDKDAYPYVIENGKLLFTGEGWKTGVELYNLYDKQKKEIIAGTVDWPMGNELFNGKAEELSKGLVKIYSKLKMQPAPGSYLSLLHIRYANTGIQLNRSKDITLRNISIYHVLSMGVVGLRTENIQLQQVNVMANEAKGRVFSAIADGFHFSTCGGLIRINNCTNTGQADDFVNIHGEYFRVAAREDDHTIRTAVKGRNQGISQLIAAGEELYFIDSLTMQRSAPVTVTQVKPVYTGTQLSGYLISCKQPLPEYIGAGSFAENKTWTPEVIITNCRFLKKNRARGLLVTTPKKVLIENNYFNTAGAAILIEGDVNFWYESGASRNIIIRKNVFEHCFTSPWGHATITITPSVHPQAVTSPAYHSNIVITNNTFKQSTLPILYARSVEGLQFTKNTLTFEAASSPGTGKPLLYMDGCRKALVSGNTYTGFPGKALHLYHMQPSDVQVNGDDLLPELK
jgi:hypothetical protein